MDNPYVDTRGPRRRAAIVRFIRAYLKEHGFPPTMMEIGNAVGLRSARTVSDYLHQLEAAGVIEREPKTPRGMRLVKGRRRAGKAA